MDRKTQQYVVAGVIALLVIILALFLLFGGNNNAPVNDTPTDTPADTAGESLQETTPVSSPTNNPPVNTTPPTIVANQSIGGSTPSAKEISIVGYWDIETVNGEVPGIVTFDQTDLSVYEIFVYEDGTFNLYTYFYIGGQSGGLTIAEGDGTWAYNKKTSTVGDYIFKYDGEECNVILESDGKLNFTDSFNITSGCFTATLSDLVWVEAIPQYWIVEDLSATVSYDFGTPVILPIDESSLGPDTFIQISNDGTSDGDFKGELNVTSLSKLVFNHGTWTFNTSTRDAGDLTFTISDGNGATLNAKCDNTGNLVFSTPIQFEVDGYTVTVNTLVLSPALLE
ncbi:hypothetical protein MsAg5_07660 [Methanosarcinaceae archaeon Ag5]|uniref:Uncharacterized protein n=1 Tax=Methanolapillus africanus TaxID=3028297 RepID=A0AAE4SDS8_9EURY|nr:hypothetical protein [Methanosarcinaceae archaeon Ag5]